MQNSILFLTNAYPDFEESYRGVFVKTMAALLQNEGYQISVVTPKIYRKSAYFEEQDGIKVYRFPFFSGNRMLIEYQKVPYLRMLVYYITGFILTIYAVIKNRCDLIHVHWAIPTGLIGVWAGMTLKRPLVVTIHGSDLRMATERPGLMRRLFIHVCRRSSHLHCVSEVQKKEIEQLGILDKNISVIPMGVKADFLEKGRNRKADPNQQVFTILSNRNLLPIYNLSLLVRAIPAVIEKEPRVRFFIAGNGSEQEELKEEVKALRVDDFVRFLGRISHVEMPTLLSQADIYVSTSLFDGTSVSLLEAMASGAFPIVTDIPSNREWISDGENGFLVPTDNEAFLAKRILEAIRNQKILMEARERNRRTIEEKALWTENIRKTTCLYDNAASSV